jgi:hypothetical protein
MLPIDNEVSIDETEFFEGIVDLSLLNVAAGSLHS